MPTTTFDLTGQWQFKQYPPNARRMRDLDEADWLETNVPSSIFTSLIDSGQIDANDLAANPENFTHISEQPWIYQKIFDAPDNLLTCDRIDLVFEGLDTIASIWLNDKLIARTNNMFIAHRLNVTKRLKPKNNRLLVKFDPAEAYARKLMARYGQFTEEDFRSPYRTYIRKAQYQFGWDFCPPLPGCGIHRPVRLEAIIGARLKDVHVRTIDCNQHYADIKIEISLDKTAKKTFDCKLKISGTEPVLTQTLHFTEKDKTQSAVIRIDRPFLWWPKGYGVQHLYQLDVELFDSNNLIDSNTKKFGVRTIRLNRTKDKIGQSFQFEINSKPIYIKGANWLPPSIFPGTTTEKDYKDLLQLAAKANINTLRVHAAGCYEDQYFYQLCDQMGILVWQDFMFANAYYPDRRWFLKEIKTESTEVIKQLRNHTCIALWCGNSQIDWSHAANRMGKSRKFYGKKIYHHILPQLLSELDPDRDYIPTTPFGQKPDINSPHSGSFHNYNVWSMHQPVRDYNTDTKKIPRFVTGFGLASLPNSQTLKNFCPKDKLRPGSYQLEKHNYQLDGFSRIYRYSADLFGPTKNIEDFVYFSQLTQARAAKTYVEHLRAHNSTNAGVLFSQFNDPCPSISLSALDYAKNPKALYYYARRFFAPILITLVGKYQKLKYDQPPVLASENIVVLNDSAKPVTANLTCRLMDLKGNTLDQTDIPLAISPYKKSQPWKLPKAFLNPQDPNSSLLYFQLQNNNKTLVENHFLFRPDKYIDWPNPEIKTDLSPLDDNKYKLTLLANTFAKDVHITTTQPVTMSDNFFDLLPSRPHELIITSKTKPANHTPKVHIGCVNHTIK